MAVQEVRGPKKFTMNCPTCSSEGKVKNTATNQLGEKVRDHVCRVDASHKWRTINGELSNKYFRPGFSLKREAEKNEIVNKIIKLASRQCGVSKSETDLQGGSLHSVFAKLTKSGQIYRMCGSGAAQGRGARFFISKEDGEKFFSQVKKSSVSMRIEYQKGPAYLDGQPDFSKAKITIAKSPVTPLRTNTHATW